jgi:FMN phosphatase YigB (HAD superfamily)
VIRAVLLDLDDTLATAAGIRAIWVNRDGEPGPPDVLAVRDLGELPALLSR